MSDDKASELFARMQDAALEDLLRTPDEDLLKEAAEAGRDTKGNAAALRERIAIEMAQVRRTRLVGARERLHIARQIQSTSRSRPSFQELKQRVLSALQGLPEARVAFREGQRQTQADWESMYDDLVELGAIQPSGDER